MRMHERVSLLGIILLVLVLLPLLNFIHIAMNPVLTAKMFTEHHFVSALFVSSYQLDTNCGNFYAMAWKLFYHQIHTNTVAPAEMMMIKICVLCSTASLSLSRNVYIFLRVFTACARYIIHTCIVYARKSSIRELPNAY